MSSVAAIVALLRGDPTLTGIVPVARIMAGVLPLWTVLPAIGVSTVGEAPRNTVSMKEPRTLLRERVQITLLAPTYVVRAQMKSLVARACVNARGTINGVDVLSILPGGDGPDFDQINPTILTSSRDMIVQWRASDFGEVFPPGPERPTLATIYGNGAPVSGAGGTGAGSSSPGRIYIDQANGVAYINESQDVDSPAWKLMAREG